MKEQKQSPIKPLVFPTPEEIKEKKAEVEKILLQKRLNMAKNFGFKEGLTDCLRILNERIKNPENEFFQATIEEEYKKANEIYARQLSGISKLKTTRGRTISVLCVDYLNGKTGSDFLEKVEGMIHRR